MEAFWQFDVGDLEIRPAESNHVSPDAESGGEGKICSRHQEPVTLKLLTGDLQMQRTLVVLWTVL